MRPVSSSNRYTNCKLRLKFDAGPAPAALTLDERPSSLMFLSSKGRWRWSILSSSNSKPNSHRTPTGSLPKSPSWTMLSCAWTGKLQLKCYPKSTHLPSPRMLLAQLRNSSNASNFSLELHRRNGPCIPRHNTLVLTPECVKVLGVANLVLRRVLQARFLTDSIACTAKTVLLAW